MTFIMKRRPFYTALLFSGLLFLLSGLMAFPQTGTIRGSIYEKETGEPVIFTNVYLKGTSIGAASDVNGLYVISRIPTGNYTLLVTSLGYDTLTMEVGVRADEIIIKNLYLSKASFMLEEVSVSAERQEARTETKISVNKVTPKEITRIPSIGGQPDLAQYLAESGMARSTSSPAAFRITTRSTSSATSSIFGPSVI